MQPPSRSSVRTLAATAGVAAVLASIGVLGNVAATGSGDSAYTRAVSMEHDGRSELDAFAQLEGMERKEFYARYGASGLVRCGSAVGSGQITLANNVITTAAHVFISYGGKMRSESCVFEPIGSDIRIPIDMTSIQSGSAKPMDERATLDWAVARLATTSAGSPYSISEISKMPARVAMFGGGNGRAEKLGAEKCALRRVTAIAPEGVREVAFDCSATHGGSGAGLLNERNEVVGIYVGYRSIDKSRAQPFSHLHYNFAITVEGPFRDALLRAAKR
jgi:hypothetical protein